MITEAQYARLPRAVQYELDRLRADERYHNKRLHELDAGPDAPVQIGLLDDNVVGLPDDVVRFRVGEASESYFDVRRDGHGRVSIRSGSPRIVISMDAANALTLEKRQF